MNFTFYILSTAIPHLIAIPQPPIMHMPPMVSSTVKTKRANDIFIRIAIGFSFVITIVIVITGIFVSVYSGVHHIRREKRVQQRRIAIDGMEHSSTGNRDILSGISSNSQLSFEYRHTQKLSTNIVRFLQPTLDYILFSGPEFVGSVQVVPCSNLGGIFHFTEHSIILKIPKEATPTEIDLEIGVAIHGKFTFPDNIRPISAIL